MVKWDPFLGMKSTRSGSELLADGETIYEPTRFSWLTIALRFRLQGSSVSPWGLEWREGH
jgi:hypothetical protein